MELCTRGMHVAARGHNSDAEDGKRLQEAPNVVHVLSMKHEAKIKDTQKRNEDGDIIQKPEANAYYNHKLGGVDSIDQQLYSIQVLRKTYKWYQIFFRILMMGLLRFHKLCKARGATQNFMHFVHDVLSGLMMNTPHLKSDPRK